MRALVDESLVVVVDVQPNFMKVIHEADRVVERTSFILEAAKVLGVPSLGTTQYGERMGALDAALTQRMDGPTFDKMTFSCCGAPGFMEEIERSGRSQIVLCGAETHICITQTALDLLEEDFEVFLPMDAISSRTAECSKIGFKRLRDQGAQVIHSESLVYEWADSASNPAFKEVLNIVKAHPPR